MPRSDIQRSSRPGLMIAPRNPGGVRIPNIVSRSDVFSLKPALHSGIFPKISHVPHISLSGAIRHLSYHVWPTKHHDIWKWNIGQLAQRWRLFNGKKCLGIVYDEQSHDPDTVLDFCRNSFGIEWDFVFSAPNDPTRGELVTWHPKLEFLLPEFATQDEVVFNAHAKGVKYEEANTNINWTTVMYEANLDNWGAVQDQLEHKGTVGCLRLRGGTDGFRYAGTFYWFRLNQVKDGRWKDIHPGGWGAEDWPARHFHWNASGCLFGDHETLQEADGLNKSFDRWRAQKTKQERVQMHPEARTFVSQFRTSQFLTVIEIGSRDINGSIRDLFPNAQWTGIDRIAGPRVDVVVDAVEYTPRDPVDMVICCEVLEHAENWENVLRRAVTWLKPGGWLVVTCAGFGREPHSVIVQGTPQPGEHYANLTCQQVEDTLRAAGLKIHQSNYLGPTHDVQISAVLPP